MSAALCDVFARDDDRPWIQFQPTTSFHLRIMTPDGDISVELRDDQQLIMRIASVFPEQPGFRVIEIYNGPLRPLLDPDCVPYLFRRVAEKMVDS